MRTQCVHYTYDNQGRLKTVTTSKRNGGAVSETTTYTYTLVGSRATVSHPNYVETSYAYNSANQLTEVHIEDVSGSPTTLAKYEYSLGLNGRRNSVVETDNDANETAIYFGYDALGRLTHETHADYQIAYTYDLVGNRLSKIRYAAPVCERYLFRKIGQPDTYVRRKRLLAERVLANC